MAYFNRFFSSLCLVLAFSLQSFAADTFYVDGRHLYDPNGEKVVLRGSNAMIVYWDRLGETTYPELAQTGANACRIFWTVRAETTPQELDQTITNCWENNMLPIICLWDATGKWENLQMCIDYWIKPEITKILQKHQDHLIVNIANEAGTRDVSHEEFRSVYSKALKDLRAAGLKMPLIIDAAHWGRGEEYILQNARYLISEDPLHNVIFSWHPWDTNQEQSRYKQAIDQSINMNICMMIGEFSQLGVEYEKPIDWEYIIEYSFLNDISWLAWVWWCCGDEADAHSITKNKIYGNWANSPWGKEIAIDHPFGIQNTAVRTKYFLEK